MELVGAVLGDDVEGHAGGAAILGAGIRRLDLDFLDEVRVDVVHQAAIAAGHQVERSVHGQVLRIAAVAVDVLIRGGKARGHAELVGVGDHRAGNQGHQFDVITAVERQVLHLLGFDHAREIAGRGVERLTRHGGDLNRLTDIAYGEFEIHREAAVGNHCDSGELFCLETLLRRFQCIRTDRKVGYRVEAVVVGFHGTRILRFHVGDPDGGSGNGSAGWIDYGA